MLLRLTLLLRLLLPMTAALLLACVDDFPEIVPATRGTFDLGEPPLEMGRDLGVDPDDGRPRPEHGVDPDDGVDRGPPVDLGTDRDSCVISSPVQSVTFRTWNDTGDSARIPIESTCDLFDAMPLGPEWLTADLLGGELDLVAAPGRGFDQDGVSVNGPDTRFDLAVQRIGLGPGDGTRRALVYVVDGLKGETLSISRPPAIDWLASNGRTTWAGTPHLPDDGATRATGWASLLTGLSPAEHQFQGGGAIDAPTFAQRLSPGAFKFFAEWPVAAGAMRTDPLARRDVIARAVEAIEAGTHLVIAGVDGAIDAQPGELDTVFRQLDGDLDALLAAIASRPIEEDWLIVVTAASPDGQGPPQLPIIAAAPSRPALMIDTASLMDVHTTVLGWLGVLRTGWALPGEQIGGPGEGDCSDEVDNDDDGRIDCRDADCAEQCDLACLDADIGPRLGVDLIDIVMDGVGNERDDCAGGPSPEATIAWVAPRSGFYTASTDGSEFDSVIEVVRGTCDGAELECVDDPFRVSDTPEPAAATFRAEEGQQILFAISGWRAPDPGERAALHVLSVRDECDQAPLLDREARLDNDARQIVMPVVDDLNIAACRRATANRLIRWAAPAGEWRIRGMAEFPFSLSLWRGGCTDLVPLGCRSDTLEVSVNDPGDHLIVFSSVWDPDETRTGTFSITVERIE